MHARGPLPSTDGAGAAPAAAAAAVCCLGNSCWEAILNPAPEAPENHDGKAKSSSPPLRSVCSLYDRADIKRTRVRMDRF